MRYLVISAAGLVIALACSRSLADPFSVDLEKLKAHEAAARTEAMRPANPQALLKTRLPEARIDAIPFGDLLDFLHDVSGCRPLIDWYALREAGVNRDTPVTCGLQDVTVRNLLLTALKVTGADAKGVQLEVIDEFVVVSTAERAAQWRELLAPSPPPPPPPPPPPAPQRHASTHPNRPTTRPMDARLAIVLCDPCFGDRHGLRLPGATVDEALADLATATGIAIRVHWGSFERRGIDHGREVNIRIPNTSLRGALAFLFAELSLPPSDYVVREQDNAVSIDLRERADNR